MTVAFDSLARGQVQVWHARLDETPLPLALAETWLSGEERERAARFHFERDRRRFVAACLFLRSLLSRYFDCSPSEIALGSAPGGKPVLPSGGDELCFNLSHSGELAVAAIAHAREVGVDVEFVGPSRRPELLASRVLSSAERAELDATADGTERQRAFLRAWTRKEALLKACGTGIDRDLAMVDVGSDGHPDARVIALADQAGSSSPWSVVSIHPAPRYVGAVAARGQGLNVISRPYVAAARARV